MTASSAGSAMMDVSGDSFLMFEREINRHVYLGDASSAPARVWVYLHVISCQIRVCRVIRLVPLDRDFKIKMP